MPAALETNALGLALGGGGARGLCHIGVWRVLAELGVRPDLVSGTSMGGLVGAFLAAGYSAEDDTPDVDESPDAVTTIQLSTHELTRRAAGRQTADETAYHVQGDEELASRVLGALDVTP